MELDCHNDDEEGVRVLAWRQDADELCEQLRKGDLVQFADLAVKKPYNHLYTYGCLSFELTSTTGGGSSSSYFVVQRNYNIRGMPVTSMHELDADIEFLRKSVADKRVRTRRVKAVVSDAQLHQFCKGLIGNVVAYDPANRTRALPMKLQIAFVPEQYRQQFKRGFKLEMRGKLSLPQLQGEPVEFWVDRFEDVDLKDNGVLPWLKGEFVELSGSSGGKPKLNFKQRQTSSASATSSSAFADSSPRRPLRQQKEQVNSSVQSTDTSSTYFKGVVISDFERMDTDDHFSGASSTSKISELKLL